MRRLNVSQLNLPYYPERVEIDAIYNELLTSVENIVSSSSLWTILSSPSVATLNAALTSNSKIKVVGTVDVTSEIKMTGISNVQLDLTEATFSSTLSGSVDDNSMRLFSITGSYNTAKLNTTLTAEGQPGQVTLTVASTGSIVAGDYIEIGCTSADGTDGYQDSGAPLANAELLKVASVSGSVISVVGGIRCFHSMTATGQYVKAITPVRRLKIMGGTLTGGNVAVGMYFRGVQEVTVDGTEFESFTRSGMEFDTSSRMIDLKNIKHLGSNNAVCIAKNVIDFTASDWSYDPDALMTNTASLSKVRNLISLFARPIGVHIHDCRFGRHAGGVRISGGHNVQIDDCSFTDMDGTAKVGNTGDGVGPSDRFGVAIDSVAADIAHYGESGIGIRLNNISLTDVVTPTGTMGIWLSDMKQVVIDGLSMVETRRKAGGVVGACEGLAIVDCFDGCTVNNWTGRGMRRYLFIENGGSLPYEFNNVNWVGVYYTVAGTDLNNDWAIKYAASAPAMNAGFYRVVFRNAKISDINLLWPSDASTRQYVRFEFHNLRYSDNGGLCPIAFCETAYVSAGHPLTAGQLVMTDGSVTDKISVASATALTGANTRRLRICHSGVGVDAPLCLISPPQTVGEVLCSSAEVDVGDILIQDPVSPTMAYADNSATTGILGIARSYKASGSSGLVELTPSAV